jgi:hypothetical protein
LLSFFFLFMDCLTTLSMYYRGCSHSFLLFSFQGLFNDTLHVLSRLLSFFPFFVSWIV